MLKKWFAWINYAFGGMIALLLIGAFSLVFMRSSNVANGDPLLKKRPLPQCAFAMQKHACDAIHQVFDLKFSPMTVQLPDLRSQLVYYGKNGRPDALPEKTVLHFGFLANPATQAVLAGERLYLMYDCKKLPGQCQYVFSANNAPTPIWMEASSSGNEAIVQVRIKNENGDIVAEPAAHSQFALPEKEGLRGGGNKAWEIGPWRVDGSLLARQKARWNGPDVFLERHGGDEYKNLQGKHRLDFNEEEETYSVYVGLNDSLIWDGKWKVAQPGSDTRDFPLMIVKKIDDRLLNFELWDVGGKNKITLNLLKSNEPWAPQHIQDHFKFMGARTRSQYIFEINDERMFLSPQDWLLQTEEGWIKLENVDLIDQYVDRKITGILFVFDGLEKKEQGDVLVGMMFNASRTDMQPIEIPVRQSGRGTAHAQSEPNVKEAQIDEYDDEDDFDEVPQKKIVNKIVMPQKRSADSELESMPQKKNAKDRGR